MGIGKVYSAQTVFLDGSCVTVETDLSKGLHAFHVVGLPDKAVEESRERVAAALKNSGFSSPKHTSKRIIMSLAPADLKKEGPSFDLPMALSYLIASEELVMDPEGSLFVGELALDGSLRPVRGILSIASFARDHGFSRMFVPYNNAEEAALVEGIEVYGARTLRDVVLHVSTESSPDTPHLTLQPATTLSGAQDEATTDLSDIRSQETAKRGLEIAAAGRHNIVLYGPPGTGKTMLARALRSILPPLSPTEALEATSIHSLAGVLSGPIVHSPPFRAPHHTSSHIALVGGGAIPRPGEVTLAHRGVLFLDEFPEFDRRSIDALREPLEDRVVSVSRAKGTARFPANFILVAAMNPNREREEGRVSDLDRERLKKKISGPVVDRIDMWIEVAHVNHNTLKGRSEVSHESPTVRARVTAARALQRARFGSEMKTNSEMSVRDIDAHAKLADTAEEVLTRAAKNLKLSPRSYHRTIKLARTIADLDQSEGIEEPHILEALTYRPKGLFE